MRRLLIKLPSALHEGAERYFTREIELATNAMGLKRQLKLLGATTVKEQEVSKQPDSSFRALDRIDGRDKKWPTVVVECGWSESLQRIIVSRTNIQVTIIGALLIITFGEIFLRSPFSPKESDYILGTQALTEFAEDTWDN